MMTGRVTDGPVKGVPESGGHGQGNRSQDRQCDCPPDRQCDRTGDSSQDRERDRQPDRERDRQGACEGHGASSC